MRSCTKLRVHIAVCVTDLLVFICPVLHGDLIKRFHASRVDLYVPAGTKRESPALRVCSDSTESSSATEPRESNHLYQHRSASMTLYFDNSHCLLCISTLGSSNRSSVFPPGLTVITASQHLLNKHSWRSCENPRAQQIFL